MLLFSRHGKVRLAKWFTPYSSKEAGKLTREIVTTILSRKTKMCNILEWQDLKIVYKRYGWPQGRVHVSVFTRALMLVPVRLRVYVRVCLHDNSFSRVSMGGNAHAFMCGCCGC
jgi:hypothetical protein